MEKLSQILQLANIVVMVLLITFVAMQNRSQGLSSVFGGSGSIVSTRRGFEKWLFYGTIAMGVLFAGISIAVIVLATR